MDDTEQLAWDVYFAGIVSMQEHPGFNRENAKKLSLNECRRKADLMLHMRRLSAEERRKQRCRGQE
jgi:hypothetical protein